VDLDGDGYLDLLSGSWPGEIFLFRGGPGHTFAPPQMVRNKEGEFINIGGGIHEEPDGTILITGNADFEQTTEGTFVNYHGRRIKSTPEKPLAVTGTASAVHAVDWDGDGVLDLLVGDIQGNVYLIPNEGTPKAYAFGKERQLQAGGQPLRVEHGDAGPFAADWDGDGKIDLLVGAGDGSVWFFRNVGTAKAPQLAAGVQLIPPGEMGAVRGPHRGVRAKVCAVDWNGDGRLDLLVGDLSVQKPDLPKPTAKQKAENDRNRKELESVEGRYQAVVEKLHGPARVKAAAERDRLAKDLRELVNRIGELRAKLPPEEEDHGWVWLYLRQPAGAKASSSGAGSPGGRPAPRP
jgi:hypothetical protein